MVSSLVHGNGLRTPKSHTERPNYSQINKSPFGNVFSLDNMLIQGGEAQNYFNDIMNGKEISNARFNLFKEEKE